MGLKAVVDNLDDVDTNFHSLYTERGGKFEITNIEGLRTQGDVDRLQTALTKERGDHKAVKDKFAPIAGLDLADVQAKLDKYPELELAAAGKIDDAKIDEMVNKRIASRLGPVERDRDLFKTQLGEATKAIEEFTKKDVRRSISDKVREAASTAKVLPEALDDALLLAERVFEVAEDGRVVTRDNVGATPGIDPAVWLSELQTKRPHWWGPSIGGGSTGNNRQGGPGVNPFTDEGWNLTEQGRVLTENPTRAEQLAKSAGTSVGGPRPKPRK